MTTISFKNRIARYYIVSTALLIFAVFFAVYYSVKARVYSAIDKDLQVEMESTTEQLVVKSTTFEIADPEEWEEREHTTLGLHPVFIQLVDVNGKILDKSPNLENHTLSLKKGIEEEVFYDTKLKEINIRQVQFPIFHDEALIGYVVIAMSLQDAKAVVTNLSEILFIGYFLILIVLYFITRFIVGRSIKPISAIIDTTSLISKDNLSTRIPLPQNKDELYTLSQTINNLLDRIESAIEREKQFTSDASHELRTPLAVIKGTLEVLSRKPRTQNEYEEKIKFCISEVNRMNFLVDELLLLARFENQQNEIKYETTFLNAMVLDVVALYSETISDKKLQVNSFFEEDFYFETDPYLFAIVLHNLISNAVKYSFNEGKIDINVAKQENEIIFTLQDFGIGISKVDIDKVFNRFYRSNPSEHPDVKGTGLGLSIVSRLSDLLKFDIEISSESQGTKVMLKLKTAE
ncbi:cell wall metabolism sensor histidine kinase WalK [Flavobacterium antarcticum]|uniref:sensor histidine kinase n=1 Tax=Flavobacterium antarcticum TaxID=271155 RepID=UPI0003B46CDC|nr:HAMP domain-containing sensor histidine kinase [Flavobacterium antarcticum]